MTNTPFKALLVEGTSGAGKSTVIDALIRRHVNTAEPRKIRSLIHLAQAHTYGPLAVAEDNHTLTVNDNACHHDRIVSAIEWLHADIIRNASKNWQANKSNFTQRNHDCADNRPNGKARSSDRIVVTYNYVNESRKNLFEVVRYEPKHFSQRRPDGGGGHIWNLDGVRLVLYRLPELIQAVVSGRVVFLAEENVTGFFSVLYEWSRAEVPAANDDEQAAVRGETSP